MSKIAKIKKLKKRIDELQEVYAQDVVSSHHEPGQTQAMIDLLNKRLAELQSEEKNDKGIEFTLESNNETRILRVVENNPDSTQGRISKESEIGAKLLKLAIGGKIQIGVTNYRLIQIK